MPQPGWYPSPDDAATLAFWDGARWTGETMDKPVSADPPLSRRELRARRDRGVAAATPVWDSQPDAPAHLPAPESRVEAGADEGGFTLGDGTVVEPVDPQEMPHPYVFDSPEPVAPAAPADDLYAALHVTPEEIEAPAPGSFDEYAAERKSNWSSDAQAVYDVANRAFSAEVEQAPRAFEPVPTEAPQYPTVSAPVLTESPTFPTVSSPIPTAAQSVPSEPLPVFNMPRPSIEDSVTVDTSVWASSDGGGDDSDFDAVLGVEEPKRPKREKSAPRSSEPLLERNRETPKARPARTPSGDSRLTFLQRAGLRSGFVALVVGLLVALGGMFAVPALLDPVPAGGPVQSGEQRATAVVRELNVDVDGYCHPTVEVPTGLGSFEVLGLKLHELNTACPVKVDESVTVYYSPNSGDEARYVRAGAVPVDLIMWSVFGAGMLVVAWGAVRSWATWKGVRIPLVTPKPQPPATLV